MEDIATIGFKAKTDELVSAKEKLESLEPAARKAESASEKLQRQMARLDGSLGPLGNSFGRLTGIFKSFAGGVIGFASGIAAAFSFGAVISSAAALSKETAKLSTNLAQGSKDLGLMTLAGRRMADEFGTNAAFQVGAFYDAVSAGATSVSAATAIVDTSNRLAIGGLTDVGTAVDVLTTVTNAYSASGLTAAAASDSMFIAAKAGKTTIGELAASMGQIVPIASALGVSFDELNSGVAALTLQGLSTSSAVTSLRAILSAIAKPSSEGAKLAAELGIEFNTAGLKAKGLAGFINDVNQKTGGAADKLSVLYGSVEALNAALAFAGAGGQNFTAILDQMTEKSGATDAAFKTMAESLDFRLNQSLAILGNLATDFGNILLAILVPALETVTYALQFLADNSNVVLGVLGSLSAYITGTLVVALYSVIASGAAWAGAFILINGGLWGAVAATGAWVAALVTLRGALIATGIGALVVGIGLAIVAILDLKDELGGTAQVFDFIGRVGAATWEMIAAGGTYLGAALKGIWISIKIAFVQMISGITQSWNSFMSLVGAGMAELPGMTEIGSKLVADSAKSSLKTIGNEISEVSGLMRESAANAALANSSWKKMTDGIDLAKIKETVKLMNSSGNVVKDRDLSGPNVPAIPAIPTVPGLPEIPGTGAGAGGGGGGAAAQVTALQQLADAYNKLTEPFDQAKTAYNALKDAVDAGVIGNEEYSNGLKVIQAEFMKTGGTAQQWAKVIENNTQSLTKSLVELTKRGFGDLATGLADLVVEGKASFGDMAKSIVKDLIKITTQAAIIEPLMRSLSGAFGFSLPGVSANANGNIFGNNVIPFAKGGDFTNSVVTKATPFAFGNGGALGVMGEAGPEAVMPLQRGPSGALGVTAHQNGKRTVLPLQRGPDGVLGVQMTGNALPFANGGAFGSNVIQFAKGAAIVAGPEQQMTGNNSIQYVGRPESNEGPKTVVQIYNYAENSKVREEKSMLSDGTEMRKIIIETVNDGFSQGDFDTVNDARYGNQEKRVIR